MLEKITTSAEDEVRPATGYKGQDHIVRSLFGPEVAARVGKISGWGRR
jgi:hypothetical protein